MRVLSFLSRCERAEHEPGMRPSVREQAARKPAARISAASISAASGGSTRRWAAMAAVAATLTVSACAGEVPMQPAVDANDPACADVSVRLPDTLAGFEQRRTNAQATGAWGNPDVILLRCGIVPSGPTTQQCVSINDVDWIIDESQAPVFRFEAYGRTPGLEVLVDSESVSGTEVILELSNIAEILPQERQCTDISTDLSDEQLEQTDPAVTDPAATETR